MSARDRAVFYRTLAVYVIALLGVLLYLSVGGKQSSGLLILTIVSFAVAIGFKMWLLGFVQRREAEPTWVVKAMDIGFDMLCIVVFAGAYVLIGRLS